MKIQSRLLLCLGILLALLAGVTVASAQGRNRNAGGGGGFGGGFGNGFGNGGDAYGGGGFGNGGGGYGNTRGGGRNMGVVGGGTVPGPTNYTAFSGFIAVRNIFNPNRIPSVGVRIVNPPTPRPIRQTAGPQFALVGTMAYEKGMFAFFDGNQSYLRKVLYQSASDNIAGYTVEEVTPSDVKLVSADKLQIIRLKVGDVMRQSADGWELAGQAQLPDDFSGGGDMGSSFSGSSSSTVTSPAPSSALEGNSVLRRLMQLRQQQLGN